MKTVASHALGCKVNQYESEAIGKTFADRGYDVVNVNEVADVYVINTCTVTNFGDKKSRQLIRKVKRQNENAIVVVVGCYAQVAPEEIMKIDGVNLVVGTKEKSNIVDMVANYSLENGIENHVVDIMKEKEFEPLAIGDLKHRTRAYVKIQDGCNQFCSYCIIPYARGPIRSRDPKDIVEEVTRLGENGFLEIVLTGIHVASYGKDRDDITFLEILEKVHAVDSIRRIRLSSIEPNVVTAEFISLLKRLPKICPHFHLSLQSGCDATLSRMNRKYTTAQYKLAVEKLKEALPNVALTTDIIVGFPGETDEEFEITKNFAKDIGFLQIHVFPFSAKKGTRAAAFPDPVADGTKTARAKVLQAIADQLQEDFIKSQWDNSLSVLVEREVAEGLYEGHTENYISVRIASEMNIKNEIIAVKLDKMHNSTIFVKKI
ncbi:MAG: tRNA (N(6)-L-threonylcarbamoyladenosine(37)-C(2))-methylthiotransferase MtaB [Bacillota bacterium]